MNITEHIEYALRTLKETHDPRLFIENLDVLRTVIGRAILTMRAQMDKEQVWFCLKCGRCGSIFYRDDTGAFSVITSIQEDHAKFEPRCTADPRIVNT